MDYLEVLAHEQKYYGAHDFAMLTLSLFFFSNDFPLLFISGAYNFCLTTCFCRSSSLSVEIAPVISFILIPIPKLRVRITSFSKQSTVKCSLQTTGQFVGFQLTLVLCTCLIHSFLKVGSLATTLFDHYTH